ncbi:hypothetical protein TNCT_557591 [Trichonephila clavata]|uniref:Uncharacterized protein n=1 Tax=Trichonephila clavata TaxID=2740835 RepID=A0A8X6M6Z6_TRICU|nr:hypothetical protein TNCT_557591 [Trichonephila clavata]
MSGPAIRNWLGVVSQVVNLFRNHSNANKIFQETIQEHAPDSKKKRLLGFVTQDLSKARQYHRVFRTLRMHCHGFRRNRSKNVDYIFNGIDSSLSESKK